MNGHYRTLPLRRWSLLLFTSLLGCMLVFDLSYEMLVNLPHQVEESQRSKARTLLSRVQHTLNTHMSQGALTEARRSIAIENVDPALVSLIATDDRGVVLASTRQAWLGRQAGEVIPSLALHGSPSPYSHFQPRIERTLDGLRLRGFALFDLPPNSNQIRSLRHGMLYLEYDLANAHAEARYQLFNGAHLLRLLLLLMVMLGLLSLFLSRWVVQPLRRLREVAEQLSSGNYGVMANISGNGEIARLGSSFDQMSQHILASREALRVSESRWLFALDGAGDGVWDWDAKNNHVFYSPTWKQMLGYSETEIGDGFDEWDTRLHPEDRNSAYNVLNRHLAGEIPYFFFEHRLRCKDGSYKWILTRGKVFERDADGKPLRVIGTHTDISVQKRTEQALDTARREAQKVLEIAATMLVALDRHGRVELANPRACSVLGWEQSDIIGVDWFTTFLPDAVRDDVRSVFVRLMRGELEPVEYFENAVLMRNGEQRMIAWHNSLRRNDQGDILGILSSGEDVTELRRQQALLNGRNQALSLLARDRPQHDTLFSIAHYLESLDADLYAVLFVYDQQHHSLERPVTNKLPEPLCRLLEDYDPIDSDGPAPPFMQSCTEGRRVLRSQLTEDPFWQRHQDEVGQYGIRACWSEPFATRDQQLRGAVCILHRSRTEPDKSALDMLSEAAELASIIIQHYHTRTLATQAQERTQLLLNASPEGIFGLDPQGRTTFANPAAAQMLGYSQQELVGSNNHELIHHSDADGNPLPIEACQMQLAIQTAREIHVEGEVLWRKDGSCFPVEYWATPILQESTSMGAVITFHDVSDRLQAQRRIEHLAYHDSLTGLPNRALFREHLRAAGARLNRDGDAFALHLLDLDHFKDINDTLGHPVGDGLLVKVAARLSQLVRETDSVARFGGDEFAILQTDIDDLTDVSLLAQRVIDTLADPIEVDGTNLRINTSIGIAYLDAKGEANSDELLTRADAALYSAKAAGRGTYAFHEHALTERLRREMEIVTAIPLAINKNQFYLEYQPQVRLTDHHLVGMEALLRWEHPDWGLLPPNSFIPLAEHRGSIEPLTHWVVGEVCRQLTEWRESFADFGTVAINLSPQLLRDRRFLDQLRSYVHTQKQPFDALEIEFTENVFMDAGETTLNAINQLAADGMQFSIDDFGTGFSSLLYLKRYRVNRVKIDKAFIDDILTDPSDLAIVKATIALAHSLGLEVVAEGVETEQQATLLRGLDCDIAQGYLFSRPVSADSIAQHWLEPLGRG